MHLEKEFVYPAVAAACAIVAAVFDIKSRRIPNFITGPALLLGLTLHLWIDGWHGLLSSAGAALIAGTVFFLFFLAGGMGGGDVKLIASAASLAGLSNTTYLLVFTALAGGVLALALVVKHSQMKQTLRNGMELVGHHVRRGFEPHPELNVRNDRTLRLPYGLAIAAGALLTLSLHWMEGVGA